MLYFPFQVSLNSFLSRSTFPCDMGGELLRIKSHGVSFSSWRVGHNPPSRQNREGSHRTAASALAMPRKDDVCFFKGFHRNRAREKRKCTERCLRGWSINIGSRGWNWGSWVRLRRRRVRGRVRERKRKDSRTAAVAAPFLWHTTYGRNNHLV